MNISTLATILIALAPALASVVSSICANAKNNSNLRKYDLRNYQRLEEKTAKIEKSFNDIAVIKAKVESMEKYMAEEREKK